MDGSRFPIPPRLCLVLCGLMATAPFLYPYHNFPFPTFYAEWLAFVLGLAALAVMGASARSLPVPAMSLGMIAFTAVLALQVALGQVAYPMRSGLGALYAMWAALIVMVGTWLRGELGEEAVARNLQWWLAIGGAVAAASGFAQYYHTPLPGGSSIVQLRPMGFMFGLVGQPNNFAEYLGVATISAAFLYSRAALGAAPAMLIGLLASAGMALSGSRTSWAYIATGFALAPLLRRGERPAEAGRVLRFMLVVLAGFVLVQVLNLDTDVLTGPEGKPITSGERLLKYLEVDGGTGALPIRLQLFLYAWRMFLARPVLGVGFGEYAWNAFNLAADLPGPVTAGMDRHSHNVFLQLLAETGVAGLLCVAVPLVFWIRRMPWRGLGVERCWALGVLAVMAIHSMVEFPLWHANFLGVFALVFGLLSPASWTLDASRLRRGALLAVLVAGILTATRVWTDYRAFEHWLLARDADRALGRRSGPGDIGALLTIREGSFFAPYIERVLSEATVLDAEGLSGKLALNTDVARTYPGPTVMYRQMVMLRLAGREEEATRVLRAAARVYPEWTPDWLPGLERLAQKDPARFSGLLAAARAQIGETSPGRMFAPLTGKR